MKHLHQAGISETYPRTSQAVYVAPSVGHMIAACASEVREAPARIAAVQLTTLNNDSLSMGSRLEERRATTAVNIKLEAEST